MIEDLEPVSKIWDLLLGSDGSMTKNLENLFKDRVETELLSEDKVSSTQMNLLSEPIDLDQADQEPYVERKVLLNVKGKKLIFAKSYWK